MLLCLGPFRSFACFKRLVAVPSLPHLPLLREAKQLGTAGTAVFTLQRALGIAASVCVWHQGCESKSSKSRGVERLKRKTKQPMWCAKDRQETASCKTGSGVHCETAHPGRPAPTGSSANETRTSDLGARSCEMHHPSPLQSVICSPHPAYSHNFPCRTWHLHENPGAAELLLNSLPSST